MLLLKERQAIVDYGRKMISSGLTTGSGGNLSLLDRQQNLIAISPSGVAYDELSAADIVIVDRQGSRVDGTFKPSSEIGFHLALYNERPQVNAVVHTHSVYATTMACLQWEIPAVHYLVAYSGDKVPLAEYATFGTKQLANNVVRDMGRYNAVLLANHGLVTVGSSLKKAFDVAEEIELVARIYYQSRSIGEPVLVDDNEMALVIDKFVSYGQQEPAEDD